MVKEANKGRRYSRWAMLAIVLLGATVAACLAVWRHNAQLEYIEGNVLNLPYMNHWNEDNLLDNPWKNAQFQTGLMYRNLFLADSSFQTVSCDLAKDYEISEDGLHYQITLKEGLLWSDGEALTAEDVVFSIESAMQSKTTNGIYTAAFSQLEGYAAFKQTPEDGLAGVEVTGENTVILHLASPYPTMLQVLAQFAILPVHCFQAVDSSDLDTADYWKDPVVSGMYQVGEVVPHETVQLVRNPCYTEEAPHIDEVILHVDYKFVKLDYYPTNNITEMINYRSMHSMTEHKVDVLFYRYFVFNMEGVDGNQNAAMQDVAVRNAIAMAIDRERLLHDIYLDSGTLIHSGVPTTHTSYNQQKISYDPDAAKALLEKSSYDLSRPLRLAYYYKDDTSKAFIEAAAADLEAIGFAVELYSLSTSADLYENRSYDLLLKGLSAFDVSEWYFEYSGHNANLSRLFGGDNTFDPLVDELSRTTDTRQKDLLLSELQTMEHGALYKIPLFTLGQVVYINEDRVNLPKNCNFGNTWYKCDTDFEHWSIKKE